MSMWKAFDVQNPMNNDHNNALHSYIGVKYKSGKTF